MSNPSEDFAGFASPNDTGSTVPVTTELWNSVSAELPKLRAELQAACGTISELLKNRTTLIADYDRANAEADQLRAELQAAQERIAALEAENAT